MRVKICGITNPDQGYAIAQLGATALGFICARQSPRYVPPDQIRAIATSLLLHPISGDPIDRIGVFVDASLQEIDQVVAIGKLNAVQLHGHESPQFCQQLRTALPQVEIIKAFRIRDSAALEQTIHYQGWVDTFLLDAYHPALLGGTGKTLNWSTLHAFQPGCPWFLAGGITPDNVLQALEQTHPHGIDLSSGVEHSPGNKDLAKVAQLFQQLQHWQSHPKALV
jgi:phosphoribosylanthranilate isomerase